jgi:hypothetical protein
MPTSDAEDLMERNRAEEGLWSQAAILIPGADYGTDGLQNLFGLRTLYYWPCIIREMNPVLPFTRDSRL